MIAVAEVVAMEALAEAEENSKQFKNKNMAKEKELKEAEGIKFDASAVNESIKVGTKFFYGERKKVEILKKVGNHYNVGDIIEPHVTKADYLISQGWAKEVK
jgi:hypothetical protein